MIPNFSNGEYRIRDRLNIKHAFAGQPESKRLLHYNLFQIKDSAAGVLHLIDVRHTYSAPPPASVCQFPKSLLNICNKYRGKCPLEGIVQLCCLHSEVHPG